MTARRTFAALETKLAGLGAGESGLDDAYEVPKRPCNAGGVRRPRAGPPNAAAAAERAAAAARLEALALGLERRDGSAALLAADDRLDGLLGSVAALISVRPGSEVAIAAALGAAADAVAVTGLDAAVNAFGHLKAEDLGEGRLLLGGVAGWRTPPAGRPCLHGPPTPVDAGRVRAQPCVRPSNGCCSRSPSSKTCPAGGNSSPSFPTSQLSQRTATY